MNYTWFRFYNDAVNDPKVQRLRPELFKFWINALCIASANNGKLSTMEDMAYALRMSPDDTITCVSELLMQGLLDQTKTGIEPHNWKKRQFKSDTSTDRVKRFRKRSKTVSRNAPDQTRTETDSNKVLNFVVGKKKGFDGNTIKDPQERLNRFQKTIAEALGRDGFQIVGAASDPENPLYRRSLALCEAKAKELGKGWPYQWPK